MNDFYYLNNLKMTFYNSKKRRTLNVQTAHTFVDTINSPKKFKRKGAVGKMVRIKNKKIFLPVYPINAKYLNIIALNPYFDLYFSQQYLNLSISPFRLAQQYTKKNQRLEGSGTFASMSSLFFVFYCAYLHSYLHIFFKPLPI